MELVIVTPYMVCKFFNEKNWSELKIKYDKRKPDGMPKKCLDISLAKKYGWSLRVISIKVSISYKDFQKNY